MSADYYDTYGNVITMIEWADLYLKDDHRPVVAKTQVGEIEVSTVWLGINHNWGDGPPLIFETMIFPRSEIPAYCVRYSTYAEAEHGHEVAVERTKTFLFAQELRRRTCERLPCDASL